MQAVIPEVLFCAGGADSVCAELMPCSMDGLKGAEGVCNRMGGDAGVEGVSECTGGEDGAEGVCESMGGDEGAERVCEHAFLCFTFCWLFSFTPAFLPTAESLSVFQRNLVPTFKIKESIH